MWASRLEVAVAGGMGSATTDEHLFLIYRVVCGFVNPPFSTAAISTATATTMTASSAQLFRRLSQAILFSP